MSLIHQVKDTMIRGKRPAIYIGGKTEAKDRSKLERYHVTHVLNMTPAKQVNIKAGVPNYFESSNENKLVYHRVGVLDAPTSATELKERSDEIVNFIAKGLCHGSVLVHCQKGVSRSTSAVLLYLMKRTGMPLIKALEHIRRRRPMAAPIPAFMEMLQTYQTECIQAGDIVMVDSADNHEGNTATDDERKRLAGPALPKGSSNDRNNTPTAVVAPMVGPTMRPSPLPENGNADTSSVGKTSSKNDSISGGKKRALVGPQLPPGSASPKKRRAASVTKGDE